MKDAGDKRPSCCGGHDAPTRRPGEQWEGLGFGGAQVAEPDPGSGPPEASDGSGELEGARPCSVPTPRTWLAALMCPPPPVSHQAPVPGLGSSVCPPACLGSDCTSCPGLGFSEGHGAPGACHLRPLPLGWTHCLPINPPPQEPGPPTPLGTDRGGGCSCISGSGCDEPGRGVERAVAFCYGGVGGAGVTAGA